MSEPPARDLFPDVLDLAAAAEPVAPRPELRAALLATVDEATPLDGFAARLAAFFDLPLARVREHLARVRDLDSWESPGLPGVRLIHFEGGPRLAAADCGFVHMQPGSVAPRHRHLGDEWSLVLQGSAQDDTGRYEPGDLILEPAGSSHEVRAVGDVPLLFASALHEGLRFEPRE